MAPIDRPLASVTFAAYNAASPLVHAYQVLRLAVVADVSARVGGVKVAIDRPVPGMLILTAHADEMAAILAELERVQVFAPLVLDVQTSSEETAEDFAEYLRDRTDTVVIVGRTALDGPAS